MTKGHCATLLLLGVLALVAACADPGGDSSGGDALTIADAVADLSIDSATPDSIADQSVTPETVADAALEVVADVAAEAGPADVTLPFVLPEGLNGEMPASGFFEPLPNFAAVLDHTGAAVTPADLVGQWTVVWFYTAASTSG